MKGPPNDGRRRKWGSTFAGRLPTRRSASEEKYQSFSPPWEVQVRRRPENAERSQRAAVGGDLTPTRPPRTMAGSVEPQGIIDGARLPSPLTRVVNVPAPSVYYMSNGSPRIKTITSVGTAQHTAPLHRCYLGTGSGGDGRSRGEFCHLRERRFRVEHCPAKIRRLTPPRRRGIPLRRLTHPGTSRERSDPMAITRAATLWRDHVADPGSPSRGLNDHPRGDGSSFKLSPTGRFPDRCGYTAMLHDAGRRYRETPGSRRQPRWPSASSAVC